MKISCPACSAKYSIADDKVQSRLAKIRCRKCGATIVIDGKVMPPHVYTTQGDATDMADQGDAGATEYSVDFGEGDQRTMTARELVTAYNAGRISGETYVWAEGFSDWKPLADVAEIVQALSSPVAGAPAPSPWEAKAAASVPRTAARTAGRSATADLFGGIDTAGSEDDVATSAPEQPAPALGGGGNASATGARNESSVLFSLSALTSAAQSRPSTRPSATTTTTSREDSGLIDLKALTAAAMKSDTGASAAAAPAMPVMPMSPLGAGPPLGLASPLGGGITSTTDIGMPQQKSRAPLIIGGGLAVGLIAVAVAIAFAFKPQPPAPPPPVVAAPAPAPIPTPAPSPTDVAKPPATGAGEEAAPGATTKAPSGSRPSGVRRPSGSTAAKKPSSADEPASAPKPAPKKSPCGCSPSDLQCFMKCAAKGG